MNRRKPEDCENCWEYRNCSDRDRKQCPVYIEKKGRQCWIYQNDLVMTNWNRPNRSRRSCSDCPWFGYMKEKNG